MSQPLFGHDRKDALSSENGEYRLHQDIFEGRKTRFVSRVMYDGTNYSGFQLQSNGQPTVQVRDLSGSIVAASVRFAATSCDFEMESDARVDLE